MAICFVVTAGACSEARLQFLPLKYYILSILAFIFLKKIVEIFLLLAMVGDCVTIQVLERLGYGGRQPG